MTLTKGEIEQVKALRALTPPKAWELIASGLGKSEYKVRCQCDPGYRKKVLNAANERKKNRQRVQIDGRRVTKTSREFGLRARDMEKYNGRAVAGIRDEHFEIPLEVISDRDRRMTLAPHSLTAALLGDPLPGLSALDRKLTNART